MIRRIEALNFRCLRYIDQSLDNFHVLVGPNASGKTTFLDVIAFLGRLVSDGVESAVSERTQNFYDLLWGRTGNRFELSVEAWIPEEHQTPLESPWYEMIRYEVAIGLNENSGEVSILDQQIWLMHAEQDLHEDGNAVTAVFPGTIFKKHGYKRGKSLIYKIRENELHISPEEPVKNANGKSIDDVYWHVVRPNTRKTVFASLTEYEFPASTWLVDLLANCIRRLELSNLKLRLPSPPGKGLFLTEDGANLPQVVGELQKRDPNRYQDWLSHVKMALTDIESIRIIERPEDKHQYLMLQYNSGLEVPSWMSSDGTLRLLALTIIPYLPSFKDVCLVEEPENSMHPLNIELVAQSMQSVYEGQILISTHSPILLGMIKPENILVFSRDKDRGTQIVRGDKHPGLKNWRGEINLGSLFAGGILG